MLSGRKEMVIQMATQILKFEQRSRFQKAAFSVSSRTLFSALLAVLSIQAAGAQVNVLTANYSNLRTNANTQETQLTTANVAPGQFGRVGTFAVDGQVYAQPLYVSGLSIPGQGVHNVLFVATMHNSVYAFDADSVQGPIVLWHVNFGPSVPSTLFPSYSDITPEIGILSTGAIDLQRDALYVVSMNLVANAPQFRLHALDLATGQEKLNGPVIIGGAVQGNGAGSWGSTVPFDNFWHIQRPGLLLANNMVYVSFGSHGDQWQWHGWVMTYNASDLSQQKGVFNATPNGLGGSFWQSGRGLAADEKGSVYAVSSNGDYDGISNFAQSFLKLAGAAPQLADWWTPSNWQTMTSLDQDLSAGPALVPGTHLLVGGDKAGQLYLVNGDAMGHLDNGSGAAQVIPASQGIIFEFALWSRPGGALVFVQEEAGPVLAYQISNGVLNPSQVSASNTATIFSSGGMAISANGAQDGTAILWETTGDRSSSLRPGTLHAYDASNLANELWNSDMANGPDFLGTFAKFARPTIANGKVYVPTFSDSVTIYGLLSSQPPAHPAAPATTADGKPAVRGRLE